MTRRVSYKTLLAQVLPYALIGAGEDEDALLLMQTAEMAVNQAYDNQKARARAQYAADPGPFKQRAKERRATHGDPTLEARRARYRARHSYNIVRGREYAQTRKESGKHAKYVERNRDEFREQSRQRSAAATLGYAKELLAKGSSLSSKDIPDELAALKSVELKVKRKMK